MMRWLRWLRFLGALAYCVVGEVIFSRMLGDWYLGALATMGFTVLVYACWDVTR